MRRIAIVCGTRPEAIKLAPLVMAMRSAQGFEVNLCATGQHKEMLKQVFDLFGLSPDMDLAIMRENQTLADLTSRSITALNDHLSRWKPDWVIVQGDTTTTLCAALAAFYNHISLLHVEAGLRTFIKFDPFPEEMNRAMVSRLADLHCAPTRGACRNLQREGIPPSQIILTGNTIVDSLQWASRLARRSPPSGASWWAKYLACKGRKKVLVTCHRRESHGAGVYNVCKAIRELSAIHNDCLFIFPVHLNPNIQEPVYSSLGALNNVLLLPPLNYVEFIYLLDEASVVMTDSGGVQEEAVGLGKQVVILRKATERPEVLESGLGILAGIETENIVSSVGMAIRSPQKVGPGGGSNPYGDGKASQRILAVLKGEARVSGESGLLETSF